MFDTVGAEDALFDGESEQVESACVAASGGKLQKLKAVLPDLAEKLGLDLGVLANHMAYRLAAQGENWWGAASNLQVGSPNPFEEAREQFLKRVSLSRLAAVDRDLLSRVLTEV